MHYTQQDGKRYHYISSHEFESLFEKAWEYPFAECKTRSPYAMLMQVHDNDYPVVKRFDSGDGLKEGDHAWEMEAVIYDYMNSLYLMMVRELYYDTDKIRCFEPRWYLIDKEEAGERL